MPLAFGLVLPGLAHAQGWIKYFNDADQFIVNFPGEPGVLEVDYTTESGATVPSRIYSVENGESRYAITVVDYTVAEEAHVARCRRLAAETDRVSPNQCSGNGYLRDIDGSVAFEAWNIRRRSSGEITYDAFGRVDGVPGHQIQILHPDESRSFIGIYMHEHRLYVLEGTVPGDSPPPGLFQQSLGMLDEMGRRVRYQRDADGNYSRVQARYEYVGEEDPETGELVSVLSTIDDGRMIDARERTGEWMPESSARVFELRTYTTEDGKLPNLLTLFRDHATQLFEKHGMTHVGYWVPQDSPESENTLIYVVSHESREAAQENWGAFRADPEWQRVAAESQADGPVVANIASVFIEATDFSPGE
jgi:hypothetical protein